MKNLIESISLFLLPFCLAIGLILIKDKIFVSSESAVSFDYKNPPIKRSSSTSISNKSAVSFGLSDDYPPPLEETIYYSLIGGLFVFSFVLPAFASIRNKPIQRTEIKLKDNYGNN